MKELDIALTSYLEKYYEKAQAGEQQAFRALLGLQDRELFEMILGNTLPQETAEAAVIEKIRDSIAP